MEEITENKTSVTKKAVNKVKSTPQKIIEHAINTAINTVEKAAQTDVKRTEKRAERTEKKLAKVQKLAKAARTEVKRATNLSSRANKLKSNSTNKKLSHKANFKERINEKIHEIVAPLKETTFYYDKRQLLVLLIIYAIFALFISMTTKCLALNNFYNLTSLAVMQIITEIICLLALAATFFVIIFPQKLAVVNKEGIKIDHNELLRWSDIALAEERYTSYISRRPFMALHLKEGALSKYRLTFMQKLCRHNIFTPFSIPMYAMRPEDAAQIRELLKKQVKYEDNRN